MARITQRLFLTSAATAGDPDDMLFDSSLPEPRRLNVVTPEMPKRYVKAVYGTAVILVCSLFFISGSSFVLGGAASPSSLEAAEMTQAGALSNRQTKSGGRYRECPPCQLVKLDSGPRYTWRRMDLVVQPW